MTELTFTIPGIEGEFTADYDELTSYKTNKQFAKSETEPAGMFDAFERVFAGHDEEYMERLGGSVEFTAADTVLREIPNRSAIRFFGTPSAANLRISAQSSKVITLQVSSAHFSPGRTAQFSTVIDMP